MNHSTTTLPLIALTLLIGACGQKDEPAVESEPAIDAAVDETAGAVKESAANAMEEAQDKAGDAVEAAEGMAEEARSKAGDMVDQAEEMAEEMMQDAEEMSEEDLEKLAKEKLGIRE